MGETDRKREETLRLDHGHEDLGEVLRKTHHWTTAGAIQLLTETQHTRVRLESDVIWKMQLMNLIVINRIKLLLLLILLIIV